MAFLPRFVSGTRSSLSAFHQHSHCRRLPLTTSMASVSKRSGAGGDSGGGGKRSKGGRSSASSSSSSSSGPLIGGGSHTFAGRLLGATSNPFYPAGVPPFIQPERARVLTDDG